MADWKEKLGNHPSYSGGGQMKKCACGREITRPGTDICGVCYSKQKHGSNTASTQHTYSGVSSTTATLPKGYLDGGYFETKNDKQYIKKEVFISWAQDASAVLASKNMSAAAIRRFYNKLKALEYKYKFQNDFDLASQDLNAFIRDVAYSTNRNVTPELFKTFIEKNVLEAQKSPEHFKSFIEHFQSVIAYFKDTKGEFK